MGWASRYIEELKQGKTVQFRPRGNSMTGRVDDGDLVTVVPMRQADGEPTLDSLFLMVDKVVLCKVNGQQYLHLVKAIKEGGKLVQIGNNKGHINGWTHVNNVYGIVTKVEK